MTGEFFDVLSIDRGASRWEESLLRLTPVEEVRDGELGPLLVKREDAFAPLGYGGVNGAKLRQLIWLVSEYVRGARSGASLGVLTGASVKSPQLSMATVVAAHFGLPTLLVIGAPLASAYRHENVRIAADLGAQFVETRVAYNPALQRAVAGLAASPERAAWFRLEYGITVTAPDARIEAFHRLGSEQVRSIPPEVDTLLVPAGSCNSVVSVLYGLARFRPAGLRRVVLFGIGPTRVLWIAERLAAIERATGASVRALFAPTLHDHPELATSVLFGAPGSAPYQLAHHDLHSTGFASYQDEMPATLGAIELHPTYEGKIATYLRRRPALRGYLGPRTLFWIVGSKPRLAAMAPRLAGHLRVSGAA